MCAVDVAVPHLGLCSRACERDLERDSGSEETSALTLNNSDANAFRTIPERNEGEPEEEYDISDWRAPPSRGILS